MAAHERAYNPIVDRDDAHSPDTSSVGLALQRQYSSLKARLSKRHLMQIAAAAVILALFAAVVVLALQEGRRRDEHRELEALRELRSQAESEAEAAPGPEPGPEIEPEPEPEPWVPPPRYSKWNISDPPADGNLVSLESSFTVDSANWEAVVEAVADAKGQIMFTTLFGADEGAVQMTANFWSWLHAAELSNNLLFLSQDNETCRTLWRFGLPCWFDEFCPAGAELPPGQYRDTFHRAWFCKYWWGLKLVQGGYDVLFLDNDNVVMSDPWEKVDAQKYDFEGLSDFTKRNKIPSPQELLARPQDCMYKHDRNVAENITGPQNQRLGFDGPDANKNSAWAMVPCMSTGLWFAHPTRGAALFLDSVIKYLWLQPDEWDQAAVQEVIVAHLLNLDDRAPRFRFRLLPHADYTNLGPYQHELEHRSTDSAIIAHPCCVGSNKQGALSEVHLWQSDAWEPEWGRQIMQGFQECLASPKGPQCKRMKAAAARFQGAGQHEFHRHHTKWQLKHVAVPDLPPMAPPVPPPPHIPPPSPIQQ